MIGISEQALEKSFEQASRSAAEEDQFLAKLLSAVVYVHTPVSDDSPNVRLIQFRHPEGFDAIPVFTSQKRALAAESRSVRTVRLPCLTLLQSSRGATLMINPNDGGPVLYPEEIDALLRGEVLPGVEKVSAGAASLDVKIAVDPPVQLITALRLVAAPTKFIKQIYLLDTRDQPDQLAANLLIYVAVDPGHEERAGRLLSSKIQALRYDFARTVDVAVYDASKPRPDFLDKLAAEPTFCAG